MLGSSNLNAFLAALGPEDRGRLAPHCKELALAPGRVLYEPGARITHLYFPNTGMVALQVATEDGRAIEAGAIGREGVVGLGGLMAGDVAFARQVVELPLAATVIARKPFLAALEASPGLRALCAAQQDAFAGHILQLVACNGLHDGHQRLARWLLMAHDNCGGEDMPVTQDDLARVLGVRRATVSGVVADLQRAKLIAVRRGHLAVCDRAGLERASCRCYGAIRANYERIRRAPAVPALIRAFSAESAR
jgi:CRP-like cAMP-binding protein